MSDVPLRYEILLYIANQNARIIIEQKTVWPDSKEISHVGARKKAVWPDSKEISHVGARKKAVWPDSKPLKQWRNIFEI